jgi:hypothetical protein
MTRHIVWAEMEIQSLNVCAKCIGIGLLHTAHNPPALRPLFQNSVVQKLKNFKDR